MERFEEKFEGNFSENSIWISTTPTTLVQTLPFYIIEAGHFHAYSDYKVKRKFHDSFLLLYTTNGCGCVKTADIDISLPANHAIIIDCHAAHEYFSQTDSWEFLWLHLSGNAIEAMLDIIYPDNSINAVNMEFSESFRNNIVSIIEKAAIQDIKTSIAISSKVHLLLNSMYTASLKSDKINQKKETADDINTVLEYIKNNFSQPITVDNMVNVISISKYHFIRRFNKIMGTTPYHYLLNYRITTAKALLRTTDKSVAEIAEMCGFLDASNFVATFKKHTSQTPLGYRHDFT